MTVVLCVLLIGTEGLIEVGLASDMNIRTFNILPLHFHFTFGISNLIPALAFYRCVLAPSYESASVRQSVGQSV